MYPTREPAASAALRYHRATDHSQVGVEKQYAGTLDPALRPRPHKLYSTLPAIPLPSEFGPSSVPALEAIADPGGDGEAGPVVPDLAAIARLCYFTDGITRRLRRDGQVFEFRAAPCTGALYHSGAVPHLRRCAGPAGRHLPLWGP